MLFKPYQAVVLLKEKSPKGLGVTDFSSDKQIKTKLSTLELAFKEASEGK